MATWPLRLSADADADDLTYSLSHKVQDSDRQPAADAFRLRWYPRMRVELCLIQGAFLATIAIGIRRRNPAILVLASAVLIKYLIHVIISPIGRLILPATALELLAIPIGAVELAAGSKRERLGHAVGALAACGLLFFGVPPLSRFVIRHDRALLPGVRRFVLHMDDGIARCTLDSGALASLEIRTADLRMAMDVPARGDRARASCTVRTRTSGGLLYLGLYGVREPGAAGMTARVEVNGRETYRREVLPGAELVELLLPIPGTSRESLVVVELVAEDSGNWTAGAPSLRFYFTRKTN